MTSTTALADARRVALDRIDVADNVRELDQAHVDALAASIALQGILVPLVLHAAADADNGRTYDLVAGFHRYAAASKRGLREVPVVLRGEKDDPGIGVDADRATENIASCRRRHEAINADSVVMAMSELKCATVRCESGGEIGISPGQIQAVSLRQTTG